MTGYLDQTKQASQNVRVRLHINSDKEEEGNEYDEPLDLELGPSRAVRSQSASPSLFTHNIYDLDAHPDRADASDGYEIPVPCSKRTRPWRNRSSPTSKTNLKPSPDTYHSSDDLLQTNLKPASNTYHSEDNLVRERTSAGLSQGDEVPNRGRSCSPRFRTLPPIPVSRKTDWQDSGYSLAAGEVTMDPEIPAPQSQTNKSTLSRQKVIYPRKGSSGNVVTPFIQPRKDRRDPLADSSTRSTPQFQPPFFRESLDSAKQKKKLDERSDLTRSPSTVSEKFEDALEYLPEDWTPTKAPSETGRRTDGGGDSDGGRKNGTEGGGSRGGSSKIREQDTGGNYEEAWDLNQGLEKKLRSLRLMHHPDSDTAGRGPETGRGGGEGNYQEPWDTAKKQQELEEKIHHARSGRGERQGRTPSQRQAQAGLHRDEDIVEDAWNTKKSPSQRRQIQTSLKRDEDIVEDHWNANKSPSHRRQIQGSLHRDEDTVEDAWHAKKSPSNRRQIQGSLHRDEDTVEDAWHAKKSPSQRRQIQGSPQQRDEVIFEDPLNLKGISQIRQIQASLQPDPQQRGADLYEEAWDMKRGLSQMLKSSQGMDDSGASLAVSQCVGKPVSSTMPLEDQAWYHGNISRDDAERMLMVCKDGSFLVRDSSDRCHYTLSIRSTRQTIHIQIDQRGGEGGAMQYILGKNSPVFLTIPTMIQHYAQHPVPIKGAEHITLLFPVHRPGSGAPETRL